MGDFALMCYSQRVSENMDDCVQRLIKLPARCALTNSIVVFAIFKLIPTAPLLPTRPPISPAVTADLDVPYRQSISIQYDSHTVDEKDAPRTRCFASRCTNIARQT